MKNRLFEGCAVALITPFDKNGDVDYKNLERILDFQLQNGTDAVIACGTTGEPATMTEKECAQVLSFIVRQVNGRIPVIAGTGGNCTRSVIEKARMAKELGADGQLCVTPFYNKATQSGLIAHYTAIHNETDLPMILYNVPSRTGVNMKTETVCALSKLPRIAGIKEASGDAAVAADILSACGNDISLYSGADELTVQLRAIGASGVISVAANIIPQVMRDIAHLPVEEAGRLQLRYMKLIRLLFSEVNPIPVKAAAAMMGFGENFLRLPLTPLSCEHEQQLKDELKRLNILC